MVVDSAETESAVTLPCHLADTPLPHNLADTRPIDTPLPHHVPADTRPIDTPRPHHLADIRPVDAHLPHYVTESHLPRHLASFRTIVISDAKKLKKTCNC